MDKPRYSSITTLLNDAEIESVTINQYDRVYVKKGDSDCVLVDTFQSVEQYHLLIKEIIEINNAEQLSMFPVWKVIDKESFVDYTLVITVSSPEVAGNGEYSVLIRKVKNVKGSR